MHFIALLNIARGKLALAVILIERVNYVSDQGSQSWQKLRKIDPQSTMHFFKLKGKMFVW